MFPNSMWSCEHRNIHISQGLKARFCGRKQWQWCMAAAQAPVNAAQSGAHEMSVSKMKNLLSRDKGHLSPLDMLMGLLERVCLEEGTETCCSTPVWWRDGGLIGSRAGWCSADSCPSRLDVPVKDQRSRE